MPRSRLTLISLLAFVAMANGWAQAAGEIGVERLPPLERSPPVASAELSLQPPPLLLNPAIHLPSVEQPPLVPPSQEAGPAGEMAIGDDGPPPGKLINLDGSAATQPAPKLGDFMGYRYSTDALEWIAGNGDQFGIFSVLLDRYLQSGVQNGITAGFGFHVFSGPVQTDMPPRVRL